MPDLSEVQVSDLCRRLVHGTDQLPLTIESFPSKNIRPMVRGALSAYCPLASISIPFPTLSNRLSLFGPTMAVSSLRIGVEIEILLCAYHAQNQCKGSLEGFAVGLAQHYNTKVSERPGQTEMRVAFDTWHASENPTNFRYWSIVEESSIDPDEDHCKHLSCSSMRPCKAIYHLPRLMFSDIFRPSQLQHS